MKIAVVAHLKYAIAEPYAGGLEAHTESLVSGLERLGHEVMLFAASGSIGHNVRVVCAPTGALKLHEADRIEAAAYAEVVEALRSEPFDLVHFNALHSLPIDAAASLQAPMVAVLHCPPFAPFERAINASSRNVTLVSVSSALALQWPNLPCEPIVIDNGVNLERFKFSAGRTEPSFAFWCGRILAEKGLHLAIDAAHNAGIRLKICGPIADPKYWLKEIEPRLGPHAAYLGHLTHAAAAGLLAKASVLVCTPCWEEPFGLVVVESLACGTPVAAFARGALLQILDPSCGALAAPDNVAELASAISAAITLDRSACRARAEIFSIDLMISRYVALYRTLVYAEEETHHRDSLLDDASAA